MDYNLTTIDLNNGNTRHVMTLMNCHQDCRPALSSNGESVLFVDTQFRPTITRLSDDHSRTGPQIIPPDGIVERGSFSVCGALSATTRTLALSFTSILEDRDGRYVNNYLVIMDDTFTILSKSASNDKVVPIAVNDCGSFVSAGEVLGWSGNGNWLVKELHSKPRSTSIGIVAVGASEPTWRVFVRPWTAAFRLQDLVRLVDGRLPEAPSIRIRNVTASNDGRQIAVGETGVNASHYFFSHGLGVVQDGPFYHLEGGGIYKADGGRADLMRSWQEWPHRNIGFTNSGRLVVQSLPNLNFCLFDAGSGEFTKVGDHKMKELLLLNDDVVYGQLDVRAAG